MLLGGVLTWRMTRRAPDTRANPGSGFATAAGLALLFWGVVAVVVGLATLG